jgi:two-component system chemotaxis sensor kinase CheA
MGRVVESSPPSLALDGERSRGRLRLVLVSDRPPELLERELTELVGRDGFTLEPNPSCTTDGAGEPQTTRWIRVPADKVDALFEGLLELRQEQGRLHALLPDASGPLRQQLERTRFRWKELYGTLMELRLVPFSTATGRLRQCVRELARELGKDVHFEIFDGNVRLDRRVLDALIDPLMHALRNALDHGIESNEERRSVGKPARGSVRLSVARRGERVRITVNDDGRGMRPDDLRRTAVRLGLLSEEETAALTDSEALMLTTLPRFTTRSRADHVSGRGVGLDVVRDSLAALGGRLQIRSSPGHGSELRLWVPLSHALIQTLLVRSSGQLYAVPIDTVLRTIDLPDPARGDETLPERIESDEGSLRLVRLSDRLHPQHPAPALSRHACALVLVKVDSDTALVVDEVIGRKELVVQPFSGPLRGLREYSGGAVMEDGTIALVLDALYVSRPAELRKGAS